MLRISSVWRIRQIKFQIILKCKHFIPVFEIVILLGSGNSYIYNVLQASIQMMDHNPDESSTQESGKTVCLQIFLRIPVKYICTDLRIIFKTSHNPFRICPHVFIILFFPLVFSSLINQMNVMREEPETDDYRILIVHRSMIQDSTS